MPIDDVAAQLQLVLYRIQQLRASVSSPARPRLAVHAGSTNLVFVHQPALELRVVAVVTAPLLHELVDRQVLEPGGFGEALAVCAFAYAWRARDNDVGLSSHGVCCGGKSKRMWMWM